ncbi:hypothetical protein PAXRUDRAFT_156974 [Paxillus rubicundulus Ve08.2h10]|uniref:Uncharacterized protein n=1 Tax=Paxillus rubicundulus Ve08.2h10 TaxID=930991 RepID=A0A0D0DHT6_9AGAM|nr:hypothetical protein PAXRUDRAFT_156974 [Paxillus rubicundulus Ve08.2h10]
MTSFKVVSQFTEDAFAQEDQLCEWPACGVLIKQGDPCFYIATIDTSKQGQHICGPCYCRYQEKPSTTTCARGPCVLPDPKAIQQSVSAVQHRSSVNPPPVIARLPPSSFPQHVPSVAQPLSGPTVHVPSAWEISPNLYASPHALPWAVTSQAPQLPGPSCPIPPPNGMLGYTPNHVHYPSECDLWTQRAYCAPPMETITIDITTMHEGSPKKGHLHGASFGSICEGRRDIDAHITAPELITVVLKVIIPSIKAFCLNFPWQEDEFTVHDECWVNLAKMDYPLEPYFYSKCFVTVSHKNTKNMVFKSKQFSLYAIVPEAQWFEYKAFIKKDHKDTHSVPPTRPSHPPSSKHASHIQSSPIVLDTTPLTMGAPTRPLDVAHTQSNVTSPLFLPTDPHTNFTRCTPGHTTITTGSSINNSLFEQPLSMDLVGADTHPRPVSHNHMSSASSITTKSPPTKRALSSALDLCSPDHTHLKEALKSGGAADLDIKKGE